MANPRPRQRQARRERILCRAAHLFAQKCHVATKVAETTEAAEPFPAIMYNYFSNLGNILPGLTIRYPCRALLERLALPEDEMRVGRLKQRVEDTLGVAFRCMAPGRSDTRERKMA